MPGKMPEKITVITADIIQSRLARDLVLSLPEKLSRLTHPLVATTFSMSRGDEIQAVCRGYLQAPEVVRQLRFFCLPLRLRVGIGVGELENNYWSPNPWDMNGSAFVRARESLESLESRGKGVQAYTRTRTVVSSGNKDFDSVVNAILVLMDTIQDRWTQAQWDAIHAYERLGTYSEAGKALGIALQNVQKRCKAAHWAAVRQAEEAIRLLGHKLESESPPEG
ncbi:MAG: hypothetical protein HPY71_13930 [Firmicutes bacterium]|nr:hypothetical protein [Bacillota bacterium]